MTEQSWQALRTLVLPGLTRVLAQIEQRHAQVRSISPGGTTALDKLRTTLLETEWPRVDLLPERLTRHELDLIPDLISIENDDDVAAKAIRVNVLAPSSRAIRRAWELVVSRGPGIHLSSLLRSLAHLDDRISALLDDPNDVPRIAAWLLHEAIPFGMLNDLQAASTSLNEWANQLPRLSTPVEDGSALWKELQRAILTAGARSVLLAHDAPQLESWARASASRVQEQFCIQYLAELRDGRSWDRDLSDWIAERLGDPEFGNLSGAWRRLESRSPGCTRDFASWRAMRKLEEFFRSVRDPHGRFAFWRDGFGDDIVDVRRVAGGEAALLYLPPLVVAEFANIGFAAYVYPASEWQRLSTRRSGDPRSYQEPSRLVSKPGTKTPYKINHFAGWEVRALPSVTDLMSRRRS